MKFENTAGFICGLFVALITLNNETMEKRVSKYVEKLSRLPKQIHKIYEKFKN